MKTEEILLYEAEYEAMSEAFGTHLLVFEFPKVKSTSDEGVTQLHENCDSEDESLSG